jgi:hypothetical protein
MKTSIFWVVFDCFSVNRSKMVKMEKSENNWMGKAISDLVEAIIDSASAPAKKRWLKDTQHGYSSLTTDISQGRS